MQQLQRHPDPCQLGVHPGPVRVLEYALADPAAGKQRRIHLGLRQLGDVIPTQTCQLRRIEDCLNAVPGYPVGGFNCPSRQALIPQLQNQLRFDLPYHYRYSFHHVAITWWKEPFRW